MLLVKAMEKVKVLQQVLDPSGIGGVSAEFRALKASKLSEKYEFQSMVLSDFRPGVNIHDILFYYKEIIKQKPDIVHIRGAAIDGLNAVIAAKMARHCKVLTTVHGMYSDLVYISPLKKWIAKNVVEKLIFQLSDGISCVCKTAENRKYFDRYRSKMLPYVYNRMPKYDLSDQVLVRKEVREQYGIRDNDVVCIYVGRMTKEKGLKTLEATFEILSEKNLNRLVFLFVGDGDYRETFEYNCKKYSIRTIFAGMQQEVSRYYKASDFFILPSLHENHSIALLEACAAKIPSVATDCGGNGEIIYDGFSGILVPIDDAERLSDAIIELLKPSVLTYYKKNIESLTYEQFSNAACDRALDSVYQQLLRND